MALYNKYNFVGQKFGRLTVLEKVHSHNRNSEWLCECECGNRTMVTGGNLKRKTTVSCGCYSKEVAKFRNIKHGMSNSMEYRIWCGMLARCGNKNNKDYKSYGAVGISVCEKWLNDFATFFEDMGNCPSPEHSIDRFPNKSGNYEPSNCRWATKKQQSENRKSTICIQYKGIKMTSKEVAHKLHTHNGTFSRMCKKYGISGAIDFYEKKNNELINKLMGWGSMITEI